MNLEQYRRLKKLARQSTTFDAFIRDAAKWPRYYAVVSPTIWTKADYREFYERITGGHHNG